MSVSKHNLRVNPKRNKSTVNSSLISKFIFRLLFFRFTINKQKNLFSGEKKKKVEKNLVPHSLLVLYPMYVSSRTDQR